MIAATIGVGACSSPEHKAPTGTSTGSGAGHCESFFGDPSKPIEIEPLLLEPDDTFVTLASGDVADLIRPSQGGHCLFLAARLNNICEDRIKLEGKLLDDSGGLAAGPAGHSPVVFVEKDGWLVPDPIGSNVPNVCACPALIEPIAGQSMTVVVTATDLVSGVEKSSRVRVRPVCRQPNAECKTLCQCECGSNGGGFCPRPSDIACETSP